MTNAAEEIEAHVVGSPEVSCFSLLLTNIDHISTDWAEFRRLVLLLDPKTYFTGRPRLSKRHRVRDNLLGTGRFSPVIRRTETLGRMLALDLAGQARETVGRTGGHLVARAASFMLLADSRASFQIEGERPPRNRLERWGRAVLRAGKNRLTLDEIVRLHGLLVEDTRFVRAGLRPDCGFLGERDHSGVPFPEFVGARAQDLAGLMAGMLEANDRMRDDGLDPVLQAAATAFAFVPVHPFQDGNGRLHRCLIHHVLAERCDAGFYDGLLARYGPNVHVNIGFDEDFRPEADGPTPRPAMKPMLDPMRIPGTVNAESGGC